VANGVRIALKKLYLVHNTRDECHAHTPFAPLLNVGAQVGVSHFAGGQEQSTAVVLNLNIEVLAGQYKQQVQELAGILAVGVNNEISHYLIYGQYYLVYYQVATLRAHQKTAHEVAHLLEVLARTTNAYTVLHGGALYGVRRRVRMTVKTIHTARRTPHN